MRFRFDVKAIHGVDDGLLRVNEVPDLATWQLVEALSLLCVILSSSEAKVHTVNLFGKTGPGNCQCSCRLDG